MANPSNLEQIIDSKLEEFKTSVPIVIDEIQKVPPLLDEVHRLIEERGLRFLLTGSSARKLRRDGANMLAGRAWRADLFPLTTREIPKFNLEKAIRFGTLPPVWNSDSPEEDLEAYVGTYLKEEIQIESNIRNLPAFSRFLKVAAVQSGQLINFAQMASDAAVAETTIKSYFQILQDTLLGFTLEPFIETKKRKAIATAKFYLFDNGVRHTIMRTKFVDRNSDLWGTSFETFIGQEIRAYLSYRRIKKDLTYWRSTSKFEVDFAIGSDTAIEVKATTKVADKHLSGLRALAEEGIFRKFYLVSNDKVPKKIAIGPKLYIHLMPWSLFLDKLWADDI
jgi:predicted AAA+ superfamily ATPase